MRLQAAINDDGPGSVAVRGANPFALPATLPSGAPGESVSIDPKFVVWSRPGRPEARIVPIRSYRGVAVRMVGSAEAGDAGLLVELLHDDAALTVPLLFGAAAEDVAADWQAWSRSLGLPLLLIEADGTTTQPVPHIGRLLLRETKPRRRHSHFASRRPRFLVRRKTGWRRDLGRVEGEELIARD